MKRLLIAVLLTFGVASFLEAKGFEKKGFLTSQACAEAGSFADCSMDSYACGKEGCAANHDVATEKNVQLVLFVHDDGKYYKLDASQFSQAELDEGLSRNDVTISGEYNKRSNTILVQEFKAPPPPKKSFFKGCL